MAVTFVNGDMFIFKILYVLGDASTLIMVFWGFTAYVRLYLPIFAQISKINIYYT